MGELAKLPNIGKKLEEQLHLVGIDTEKQLRETGSRAAWQRILAIDDSACYMRLCALEGALENIRWHDLPPRTKQELKAFYQKIKKDASE